MARVPTSLRRAAEVLCIAAAGLVPGAATGGAPPRALPPSDLHYQISARVDPETRALSGRESIRFVNTSTMTLRRVPIHLYLNAFAHTGTTWLHEERTLIELGFDERRYRARHGADPWGFIDIEWARQAAGDDPAPGANDANLPVRAIQPDDGNPWDRTLVEVELARPVPPGGELRLEIAFSGKLPAPIMRTGCVRGFCLLAQWYPKLGMLERAGVRGARAPRWAARQFHAPTEFYAPFADYDVTLDVPAGWLVAATGRQITRTAGERPGRAVVRYRQGAVHDFAAALGEGLAERSASYTPRGAGQAVSLRTIGPVEAAALLPRTQRAVEGALDVLARAVGPYPYATLTVILPPYRARKTAGMEYPTLITAAAGNTLWLRAPASGLRLAELTAIHELAHQYFYGLVATNEQQEAFLDEGLTTYWEGRIARELYGTHAAGGSALGRPLDMRDVYSYALGALAVPIDEPIRREPSALYYPGTHFLQIYVRTAQSLWTVTEMFGEPALDRAFALYFERHRFRHPGTEDLLTAFRDAAGAAPEALLREALTQPRLPDFEVTRLNAAPFAAPLGRVPVGDGAVQVTPENRNQRQALLTDHRMRDAEGKIWLEVTDPGWSRSAELQQGGTSWRGLEPRRSPGKSTTGDYHESRTVIRGPAWDHLPVEVLLRFADGAEVIDRWDGRAAWRAYRAIRGAPLVEVRVDPERRVALDPTPQNNARSAAPDRVFLADWSGWIAGLAQWLAAGASLCL